MDFEDDKTVVMDMNPIMAENDAALARTRAVELRANGFRHLADYTERKALRIERRAARWGVSR